MPRINANTLKVSGVATGGVTTTAPIDERGLPAGGRRSSWNPVD